MLDLPASFSTKDASMVVKLLKPAMCAVTLVNVALGWSIWLDSHPGFFLAYLSHWGLIVTLIYQIISSLTTLCSVQSKSILCCEWQLFETAVVFEVIIVLLYWVLVFDAGETTVKFQTVCTHGISFVLLLIDGLILNRVPVRLKHLLATMGLAICYAIWGVIHAYTGIGNPHNDESDFIYDFLDWKNEPVQTAILNVLVVFVAVPVFHLFFWVVSFPLRRYEDGSGTTAVPKDKYDGGHHYSEDVV